MLASHSLLNSAPQVLAYIVVGLTLGVSLATFVWRSLPELVRHSILGFVAAAAYLGLALFVQIVLVGR